MKKKLVAFVAMSLVLISCSTTSEDYTKAADELCECMAESGYDGSDATNIKTNIGICLLDSEVNLKDPKMLAELDVRCPEIKEGFEEFVKGI